MRTIFLRCNRFLHITQLVSSFLTCVIKVHFLIKIKTKCLLFLFLRFKFVVFAFLFQYSSMIYHTRIEHFNAAHRLFNAQWSEEKNVEVFGKCANKNYHGHNYKLYVTVKGTPNIETGFIVNAKILGRLIEEKIIEQIDHKNLNIDVPFMQNKFTSVENVIVAIWNELEQPIADLGSQLHKLKLEETPNIFAEYYG